MFLLWFFMVFSWRPGSTVHCVHYRFPPQNPGQKSGQKSGQKCVLQVDRKLSEGVRPVLEGFF